MLDKIAHFKILEKIGEGGMGDVYLAHDTALDRKVALKFLPAYLTPDKESKERLKLEAKSAAALNHPNIITIHEFAEYEDPRKKDKQTYFVMEYIEGQSLRELIVKSEIALDLVLDIATQICKGLKEAHKAGIIHRDIKPENILIDSCGQVKILDFGLAKFKGINTQNQEGLAFGTIQYMSPEQSRGEIVDQRSDIWSLGVILYEMLAGRLPFIGDYEQAIIFSLINEDAEPIANIPRKLNSIINKCLAKQASNRYQNIDELLTDLHKCGKKSEAFSITKISYRPFILPAFITLFLLVVFLGYLKFYQPEVFESTTELSKWDNSIAVLPFVNLSSEKDQEYFCDGMTEQIITNLSKINRLKVIARTSVMAYRNSLKQIPEIGRELNVSHILEGSIRKNGNSIRVTAQLVNTEDGSHIWADNFDRELRDIFEVQDDISEKIAANLLTAISPNEISEIKTNKPRSIEAYEYYMQGRYFHFKFISGSIDNDQFSNEEEELITKSENMFIKSIAIDPFFADSYAYLANIYNIRYFFAETDEEENKYMFLQQTYIDTAYQLDPNSAEVNWVKGSVHYSKRENDQAFKSYKTAIEINPNNSQYYQDLGLFLHRAGLTKLAIKCYDKAIELNPLIMLAYRRRGIFHYNIGNFNNAEKDLKKALELAPDNYVPAASYWLLLMRMKRYNEADGLLKEIEAIFPDRDIPYLYALHYAVKGQKDKALKIISSVSWSYQVYIFTLLGMQNEAIELLSENTVRYKKMKASLYLTMKSSDDFDALRDDPRFQELLTTHKEIYIENFEKYREIYF